MSRSAKLSIRSRQTLAIILKDIKMYYTRGPTLIFGLLFPSFFFLAFVVGRNMDPIFLMPGLLAMVMFFSATAVSPVIMPIETGTHTLERLITYPAPYWVILLGDTIASFMFAMVSSSIPLIMVLVFISPSIFTLIFLIGITVLGAFFFSFFGLLLSSPPADQPSTIMMITSLVKFPLIFISGIFVPLANLPPQFQSLALFSPLTYFVDLFAGQITGRQFLDPTIDFIVILCMLVVLAKVTEMAFKRSLSKRL